MVSKLVPITRRLWQLTKVSTVNELKNVDPKGLRDPECPFYSPNMVCPLAPSSDDLFITAAEVKTTMANLPINASSGNARLVRRRRVGANDKITSDT